MRCESCGADLPRGKSVCEFCGSTCDRVLPAAAAAQLVGVGVYDRIKASQAWSDRDLPERSRRHAPMPAAATIGPLVFLVIFIAMSGFMVFFALGMSGLLGLAGFGLGGPLGASISLMPAFMALVPIGFVVLGVFMIQKHWKIMSGYRAAPTEACAAVITGKRMEVSGGGGHSSASTCYFVTAELEDGRREEFSVMAPEVYGRIREGDAGVLFVRSRFALDFDRVAV